MVFDEKRRMLLFEAGSVLRKHPTDNYELYNDLWAFNVNTDTWAEVDTSGDVPAARTNSAMVYDSVHDRLILFGGSISGQLVLPLSDTNIWTWNIRFGVALTSRDHRHVFFTAWSILRGGIKFFSTPVAVRMRLQVHLWVMRGF